MTDPYHSEGSAIEDVEAIISEVRLLMRQEIAILKAEFHERALKLKKGFALSVASLLLLFPFLLFGAIVLAEYTTVVSRDMGYSADQVLGAVLLGLLGALLLLVVSLLFGLLMIRSGLRRNSPFTESLNSTKDWLKDKLPAAT